MNLLNKPLNEIRFRFPKFGWPKKQENDDQRIAVVRQMNFFTMPIVLCFCIAIVCLIVSVFFMIHAYRPIKMPLLTSEWEMEIAGFKVKVNYENFDKFSNDLSRLSRELGYFEGQKDAIAKKIRIAKTDSTWTWTETPWDDTDSDHSIDHLKYYPQNGIRGSIEKILSTEGILKK